MKRWLILAILVVALTAAGTVVLQTLPTDTPTPGEIDYPVPLATEGPKPKAVVDGELTHHFDTMAQETTGEKVWTITNEGPGDLLLKKGTSTCSCTIVELQGGRVGRPEAEGVDRDSPDVEDEGVQREVRPESRAS